MFKPLISAAALCCAALPALSEPFTIVALGDAPYGDPGVVYAPFETLIGEINAHEPELVIHVGDTKSGSTPCSDEMLNDQKHFLNSFAAPLLYAIGDNEWTDCYRSKAGGYEPQERLAYIRDTYFTEAGMSLGGEPVAVESQAEQGFPENMRLMHKDVMIMVAHVVGSNNNFEPRSMENIQEYMERDAANIAWLRETFAKATDEGAKALVLGIQADMFEFTFGPSWNREGFIRHSGFANFGERLKAEAAAFGKPVLLVYGDSHVFRQSRPFPDSAPNIMGLEVPGSKNMDAVEITIDPETSGVFSVALIQNPDTDW